MPLVEVGVELGEQGGHGGGERAAHEDYDAYMPGELVEIWHAWDPDQALPHELPGEVIQFYRACSARR